MKRNLATLLMLTFLLTVLAEAEVFKIKPPDGRERKEVATEKSSGKTLWKSTLRAQKFSQGGKTYLYLTDKGSGIYGKDRSFKSWESTSYYTYDGTTAVPDQGKLVYKDQNGKVIQTIEKIYHPEKKTLVFRNNGKDTAYDMASDLIDRELLGTAVNYYPFEEKRDFVFHLLTNEPRIYPMTLRYIGEENLMIAGKPVPSYKVQMIPDLGALNLLGAFVPKTYFWFTQAEPREFLRYEGLESGLGTPYIVIEAID